MATAHPCLLRRERGESPISPAHLDSRRDQALARSTPSRGEGLAGSRRGPLVGPRYGTVRPAEGRPAIVTGSAGVSCPVTLAAGVADFWSRRRSSSASPARRLHYTSTLTQLTQARQAPSSRGRGGLPSPAARGVARRGPHPLDGLRGRAGVCGAPRAGRPPPLDPRRSRREQSGRGGVVIPGGPAKGGSAWTRRRCLDRARLFSAAERAVGHSGHTLTELRLACTCPGPLGRGGDAGGAPGHDLDRRRGRRRARACEPVRTILHQSDAPTIASTSISTNMSGLIRPFTSTSVAVGIAAAKAFETSSTTAGESAMFVR